MLEAKCFQSFLKKNIVMRGAVMQNARFFILLNARGEVLLVVLKKEHSYARCFNNARGEVLPVVLVAKG